MCIRVREKDRGRTPDPPQYSSIQVETAAVDEADEDLRRQLTVDRAPVRPMVRDGVAWFGRIKLVVLETTGSRMRTFGPRLLQPSRSFVSDSGQYLWTMPPNLQNFTDDCGGRRVCRRRRPGPIVATPVNFFRRVRRPFVQRRNGEYSLHSHAAKA
ncbi:hypothetical protein V1520DRAFT_157667 [Lipomyces starkeyi]